MTEPTENTPCSDWCGGECAPDEGFHLASNVLASRGGPMNESADCEAQADLVPTVTVVRHDGAMAEVSLTVNPWIRSPSRAWIMPGALCGLLPAVGMTSKRARYLGELLTSAAAEADRINDTTAADLSDLKFMGHLLRDREEP